MRKHRARLQRLACRPYVASDCAPRRIAYFNVMDVASIKGSANSCHACAIRNRAICADLDGEEIKALNSIGRRRKLRAGEQLLWEGDEALLVANVVEGVLKLSSQTADGKTQILGLAYPSDFIGRPFGEITPYGAKALTDALVCVFHRKDFDGFAREHPRLEHKLLERTLTELDRTRRWMLLLGRMSAKEKIAAFLLELAERLVPHDCSPVALRETTHLVLPLSRQQIADVLGLTIETVSRQLTGLKKAGLIEITARRGVEILDPDRLRSLSG